MAKINPRPNIDPKKGKSHRPSTNITKVKPRVEKRFAEVLRSRPLSTQRVHSIAKNIYAEYHWKSTSSHNAPEKAVNAMSEALLNLYAHAINAKSEQNVTARQLTNAIRLMKLTRAGLNIKGGGDKVTNKTRRVFERLANGKTRALLENLEKLAFEQADGKLSTSYNKKIKKLETEHKQAYWKDPAGRKRKIPLDDLAKMVKFGSLKIAVELQETNGVLRLWLGKK